MNLQSHRKTVTDDERESRGIGGLIVAGFVVLLFILAIATLATAGSAHADEPSSAETTNAGANPAITSPEWHTVTVADADSGSGSTSFAPHPSAEPPAVTFDGIEAKCYSDGSAPEPKSGDRSVRITYNEVTTTCIATSTRSNDDDAFLTIMIIIVLFGAGFAMGSMAADIR